MTSKELSGIILKETEKAFLLLLDKDKQEWFPRSQMSNINTGRIDQEITFSVPEWLYNAKHGIDNASPFPRYDDYGDVDNLNDELDHLFNCEIF